MVGLFMLFALALFSLCVAAVAVSFLSRSTPPVRCFPSARKIHHSCFRVSVQVPCEAGLARQGEIRRPDLRSAANALSAAFREQESER